MFLLPPLPDSIHFVIPEYPTAPFWGHPGKCSSPNPKSAEAPHSGSLHWLLFSNQWSWSRPLQVLSSLGYRGLTLCLWNDWVSLWSELPFRLMPWWWLSTDQHDRESVAPESGVTDLYYQKLRLFTLDFFIQVETTHLCPEWWERLP